MIWSPVGGGRLLTGDDEKTVKIRDLLTGIAKRTGLAGPAEAAIAFVARHPARACRSSARASANAWTARSRPRQPRSTGRTGTRSPPKPARCWNYDRSRSPRGAPHLDALRRLGRRSLPPVGAQPGRRSRSPMTALQPVFRRGSARFFGGILVFGWCRLRGVRSSSATARSPRGLAVRLLFALEFVLFIVGFDLHDRIARHRLHLHRAVRRRGRRAFPASRRAPDASLQVAGLVAAFVGVVLAFSDKQPAVAHERCSATFSACSPASPGRRRRWPSRRPASARRRAEKVLLYQLAVSAVRCCCWRLCYSARSSATSAVSSLPPSPIRSSSWSPPPTSPGSGCCARYPAGRSSAFTFLTPVFAVLFGGLLLGRANQPLADRWLWSSSPSASIWSTRPEAA